MKVSYSYYEDEVRDGFYISGMMKRAWAASIEVLEVIDAICKKHNIKYFADAGTLLGAIRHKGFIPWDDDLDIGMLREEYEHFIHIVEKELPEEYSLLNMHTEKDYLETFSRIVNRRNVCFEEQHLKKYHNFPFVVGIDIFPLDYIAPDPEEEELRCELAKIVSNVAHAIKAGVDKEDLEPLLVQVEKCCKVSIERNGHIGNQLMLLQDHLLTMYHADEAAEVALMPVWIEKHGNKFKKEYFEKFIEVDFENIKVPVPTMYDAILREKYGDYMKLVHNWEYHDYPFFGGQMQFLEEQTDIKYPRYAVTSEEVLSERLPVKKDIKKQAEEMTAILKEAQSELLRSLETGKADVTFEILEMCQNGAISLGGVIEECIGEGHTTVGILEAYCERVYRIYEALIQGDGDSVIAGCNEVQQILGRLSDSIENDIKIRKKVVFLPYKAETWATLESIWKAAKGDPDYDVYVIPIPYYEKDAFCNVGEMHYAPEEFPSYVPITSYKEYDFEKRLPDVMFIQNPYDEYNYTTTVHPFFYAKNLKQYTNKLVYIPPFVMDEINPGDGRAMASLDYFAKMPGVVHADEVIVQSEEMRQTYIEALTEFAGEETRHVWETKILGTGSPLMDVKKVEATDYDIPEAWLRLNTKPDGTRKKVVLYCTGISNFAQNGNGALQKLQDVMEIFKENRDAVTMLWRPHPKMREAFEEANAALWEAYQEIVERYQAEGWGIYDDTPDADMALALCDAYYGDTGELAQRCRVDGKPVMIQSVE